jgi:hypothetical protein
VGERYSNHYLRIGTLKIPICLFVVLAAPFLRYQQETKGFGDLRSRHEIRAASKCDEYCLVTIHYNTLYMYSLII